MVPRKKNFLVAHLREDFEEVVKKFAGCKDFASMEMSIQVGISAPSGISMCARIRNFSRNIKNFSRDSDHETFLDIKTVNYSWRALDKTEKNTLFSIPIKNIYTQEEFEKLITEDKSTISNILFALSDIDDWEIIFE